MNISDIEIHAGKPDFDFTPVRRLEAKAEGKTAFSRPPTNFDVDQQLRQLAAKVGADAVIEVQYDRGVSLTSWQSLKATGLAVKKVSDTIQCPVCAETIKRAALKCRFCGTELQNSRIEQKAESAVSTPRATVTAPVDRRPTPKPHRVPDEPLKSTDNPQTFFIILVVVIVVLFFIGIMSGS